MVCVHFATETPMLQRDILATPSLRLHDIYHDRTNHHGQMVARIDAWQLKIPESETRGL